MDICHILSNGVILERRRGKTSCQPRGCRGAKIKNCQSGAKFCDTLHPRKCQSDSPPQRVLVILQASIEILGCSPPSHFDLEDKKGMQVAFESIATS